MTFWQILGLLVLSFGVWFWHEFIHMRDLALTLARSACRKEHVQLLDETVTCRSIRIARNPRGQLSWRCIYYFEYSSDGEDRFQGSMILIAGELSMLDLSAHRPFFMHNEIPSQAS